MGFVDSLAFVLAKQCVLKGHIFLVFNFNGECSLGYQVCPSARKEACCRDFRFDKQDTGSVLTARFAAY